MHTTILFLHWYNSSNNLSTSLSRGAAEYSTSDIPKALIDSRDLKHFICGLVAAVNLQQKLNK